jgi:FlaA1/EpsC-like NDP-sugar epimerase
VGSRISYAALSDIFAQAQLRRVPHVLIVGATDLGEIVLRSLLRSRPATYQAIGFVDADPRKRNRSIHGVQVLGTPTDLERLVADRDIDAVILALPHDSETADLIATVRAQCEAIGVPCHEAAAFVEMHFTGLPGLSDQSQPDAPLRLPQ